MPVLSWLCLIAIVLLSVVDQSWSMESCDDHDVNTVTSSHERDLTTIAVKVFSRADVNQIPFNGRPNQECTSAYRFSPSEVEISSEVIRKLLIHQRRRGQNRNSSMINRAMPSVHYNRYETKFQAKTGEWKLFSKVNFRGCSIIINPSHGRIRVPFTVKSIKPVSAKGIKRYRGKYFVSLMDFTLWMKVAYPDLPLNYQNSPTIYIYLNQMLWFDLTTQIFRDNGGLIRINNAGDAFPDHPFNQRTSAGETTLFIATEFPPLSQGEPPVVLFQSILNPFNFLGVRRNPSGILELVSDTDGFEASEFFVQPIGTLGFNLLRSREFDVFVAVDTSSPTPEFELLPDEPVPISRGSFILL